MNNTTRRVVLLGTGQRFPHQLTAEVLEYLRQSAIIYTLLSKSQISELPEEIAVKCVSVSSCYESSRTRRQNYAAVVEMVLDGTRSHRIVAYLTLGSPRVLDSVAEMLVGAANEELEVVSVPSVSSFDSVLSDVGYDPASGVQVVEATNLLIYRIPLVCAMACLVFQPSMFLTDKPRLSRESPAPDLRPLRDYLLRTWPPDHPAAFVFSAFWPDGSARVHWTSIDDLHLVDADLIRGTTMFVPPVAQVQVDQEIIESMRRSEFG